MSERIRETPPEIIRAIKTTVETSSGFSSTLQTIRMVVFPLLMSVPALLVWSYLYDMGWHSNPDADGPIVNAILPWIGSAHVFLAGFIFLQEGKDIRGLKNAVRNKDVPGSMEQFLQIVEDKVPTPLRYILLVTGNIVIFWTMSLYYQNYWSGFFSVLCVAYIISLIWEVVADFDDPVNGVWVVKGIPKEWIEKAGIKRRLSDRVFEFLFGE